MSYSYWWSFETKFLSPAVFEILRSKRIGVTSLTFQGHVTSSATWSFDSPYAISYWWSFGTKSLSVTVSEISNVKCNAMVDVTLKLIRPLNKGQGHSFWRRLYNLYCVGGDVKPCSINHFGTNRFLIYDFLQAVNSNFCSRTHRLATIHNVTDDRQTTTTTDATL